MEFPKHEPNNHKLNNKDIKTNIYISLILIIILEIYYRLNNLKYSNIKYGGEVNNDNTSVFTILFICFAICFFILVFFTGYPGILLIGISFLSYYSARMQFYRMFPDPNVNLNNSNNINKNN